MDFAVLCDFDGTISEKDTAVIVFNKFINGNWRIFNEQLDRGELTLEQCMREQCARGTAFFSLSLEQVPKFRSSMMSLFSACMNLGMVLGASLGGFALIGGEWAIMGVSIGVLGLFVATILKIWAVDPVS